MIDADRNNTNARLDRITRHAEYAIKCMFSLACVQVTLQFHSRTSITEIGGIVVLSCFTFGTSAVDR